MERYGWEFNLPFAVAQETKLVRAILDMKMVQWRGPTAKSKAHAGMYVIINHVDRTVARTWIIGAGSRSWILLSSWTNYQCHRSIRRTEDRGIRVKIIKEIVSEAEAVMGQGTMKGEEKGQHLAKILMDFGVEKSRWPIRKGEDQTSNVAKKNGNSKKWKR